MIRLIKIYAGSTIWFIYISNINFYYFFEHLEKLNQTIKIEFGIGF